MNRTTVHRNLNQGTYSRTGRLSLALPVLLIWASVTALAQNAGRTENATAPLTIRVTHILGFEDAPRNAKGTLSIQQNALQFEKSGRPAVQVTIASIQDVFIGEQSKQVGGVPMTLGKTATPFGGGRVISLFAHKKYDTLSLEYVDANGGVHGAIFQLSKGQAEDFKKQLTTRGAHVSQSKDEPGNQSTGEVANESN